MKREISHPSSQELLMALDGELASAQAAAVRDHLASCWECRSRSLELERSIATYVETERASAPSLPSAEGPRAQLKARMHQLSTERASARPLFGSGWRNSALAALSATAAVAAAALLLWPFASVSERAVDTPDPALTPGATVLVSQHQICSAPLDKNKDVPAALRTLVFREYGISGAAPQAYEVDYLITPALGGADDIHNLWPHSQKNTRWNSRVKDALEDRLRGLVCSGEVELSTAQRELATNWIEAYKKYFGTDRPFNEN